MLRALLFAGVTAAGLCAQAISDSFESPTLTPPWTIQQQAGTVGLSTDQAVSGTQSLKFTSASTGQQRTLTATRHLPAPSKGLFTVYFYDRDPGLETLYMYFDVYNSLDPSRDATIGVHDYDAFCYQASGNSASYGAQGPYLNCSGGIYPNNATTNVRRTPGWHRFDIDVQATSIIYKIDGNTVFTYLGDLSFDTVTLSVSGPYWRPNTVAYFDDFSFTPLQPAYSVCPLYDQSKAVKSGATVPIKIQLCDSAGANLSSASIAVHATALTMISTATSETIQDAGSANPDNDFRYDATLAGYIFNLKTSGLLPGTYRLSFTAGTSPTPLNVQFVVK